MNKIIIFFIYLIFITGCSFNENSKFWTTSQNIKEDNSLNYKEILIEEEALEKEFNANISINLGNILNNNKFLNIFWSLSVPLFPEMILRSLAAVGRVATQNISSDSLTV